MKYIQKGPNWSLILASRILGDTPLPPKKKNFFVILYINMPSAPGFLLRVKLSKAQSGCPCCLLGGLPPRLGTTAKFCIKVGDDGT